MLSKYIVTVFFSIIFTFSSQVSANDKNLIFEEFDAREMNRAEKRLLQTGLALEGDYIGLIDGIWGRSSQTALEDYAQRNFPVYQKAQFLHAFSVIMDVVSMTEKNGWEDKYFPKSKLSIAAPWGILKSKKDNTSGISSWSTDNESLEIKHFEHDDANTYQLHESIKTLHTSFNEPYFLRRQNRLVTKVHSTNGYSIYLRSEKYNERWQNVMIGAQKEQAYMLSAISSGIYFGPPRSWDIPEGSLISRVVNEGLVLLGEVGKKSPSNQQANTKKETTNVNKKQPSGFGTAFYINNTDLITAEHVVANCSAISLKDGTNLNVISTDESIDLAILSSPHQRSQAWLPVASTGKAVLGEQVYALGYPYYMLVGTSLNLTTGNVSALAGYADDNRFITISAPVQPGNSGGPLLNKKGEILGMISARLSESAIIKATGTLPQNINYAVTGEELIKFLHRSGVLYPRGQQEAVNLSNGIPEKLQTAVMPVFCW
ncbi:hypothetical protein GCM10022421_24090 [Oceanisphaera sediminis]|uniref:Serine protease n=1 Tax=Oceanisphaera sediminis TaxID=981381 RepID=A0ABP7EDN7_9GAMM